MKYLLLLLLSGSFLGASAQVQQITHQTFNLSDSVITVELDVYGVWQVEPWPGNTILLETQVRLYNASQNILDHLLESGRYELEPKPEGTLLRLVSKDQERSPVKSSKGECFEETEQLLYLPEEFVQEGENRWSRPAEIRQPEPASPPVDTSGTRKGKK